VGWQPRPSGGGRRTATLLIGTAERVPPETSHTPALQPRSQGLIFAVRRSERARNCYLRDRAIESRAFGLSSDCPDVLVKRHLGESDELR
jgi:hypothetical protein